MLSVDSGWYAFLFFRPFSGVKAGLVREVTTLPGLAAFCTTDQSWILTVGVQPAAHVCNTPFPGGAAG